jgi:membrane-associated phospholipid phosphatase
MFDHRVYVFFLSASGLEQRVAVLLSDLGDPEIFVTITALIALALIFLDDYRAAVTAVVSAGLAWALVEHVLKPFFDPRLGPAFPSGHTAVAVALAGAVTLAASGERPLGRLLGAVLRNLLKATVLVLSGTIGLAMVVLELHYLSDVVAAIPLGLSLSGCTALLVDVFATRWRAWEDREVCQGQETSVQRPSSQQGQTAEGSFSASHTGPFNVRD